MKSWTSPASYLSKDTFSRWLKHPASPLARYLVAALLAGVSALVLCSFGVAEKVVVSRLEKTGLNAIVITAQFRRGETPSAAMRYSALVGQGDLLTLTRVFRSASTGINRRGAVFSYSESSLAELANLGVKTPYAIVTNSLPAGIRIPFTVDGQITAEAETIEPKGVLRLIPHEAGAVCILIPESVAAPWLADGGMETTVFERRQDAPVSLQGIMESIETLNGHDQVNANAAGPVELMNELTALRSKQGMLKAALGGVFALVLVAVFSSLSVLEYRQNAYVSALLRTFGVRRRWLFGQYLAEALIIANLAGFTATGALYCGHNVLALTAGSPETAGLFLPILLSAGTLGGVFAALNLGAITATLPVALMVRRPPGLVL